MTGDENAQLNNIAIDGSIFGYTVTTVGTFSLNNATPDMDLGWVVRNVGATTPLWLYATQTGFTTLGTANATFSSTIDGGTATGTVRGSDGDANNPANLAPVLLTLPISAPGGFTQGSASLVGPSPYSFAIGVTLSQTGASSGDLRVRVVPEPASMTLFGLGLMGFGVASRRRKANQAK